MKNKLLKYSAGYKLFFAICILMLGISCNQSNTNTSTNTTTTTPKEVAVPQTFSGDSAFVYTKKQVDFGPRIPNSSAHEKCAIWIVDELKQYMDTVIVQEFKSRGYDGKILSGKNIIGSINPKKGNRILLSSHWDTRPWADQDSVRKNEPIDGANDGASGVGTLIEIARQLAISKPDLGVDIVLFDLEDYGQPENSGLPENEDSYCLGTQYWAKNLHVPNYFAKFGILLDMTGATNATFTQEGTSRQYASEIVDKVWKAGNTAGYGQYFLPDKTGSIIDDHYYINGLASIKMIDIIHYDFNTRSHFWKHWHTHGDTIDKIDPITLKAVGQTLMQVLYEELASS